MTESRWTRAILIASGLLLGLAPTAASGTETADSSCFACHNNPQWQMELALPDGEAWSLYVDKDGLEKSVHGSLRCVDCHAEITGFPHAELSQDWDRRDITVYLSATCRRCHPEQVQEIVNSAHAAALDEGKRFVPVCSDCHGSHQVKPVDYVPAGFAPACGKCHQRAYDTFAGSVHGTALLQRGSPDAPTCADCHGAHQINGPQTTEFRARSPGVCARCHADKEMMSKYGISTAVFRTYVADFHGTTAALFQERPGVHLDEAVCYDCHGAHEITAINGAGLANLKQNLLQVCQQCHPGATANFPSAWMGHYEPSPQKYPAVYYARLFYMILIPGLIAFFIIVVSWDMVHNVVQRSARRLEGWTRRKGEH
jgi:predicted CXXCH cytochrome family protein